MPCKLFYFIQGTTTLNFNPNLLAVKPNKSVTTRYSLKLNDHKSLARLLYDQEKEVLIEIQDSYGKVVSILYVSGHIHEVFVMIILIFGANGG